jgi:hypothetical protein
MNDKASQILKNIEEKKIKPKSKWIFLAKDYLVWVFFGLATLTGAAAISVIIFVVNDNDWDIYKYLQKSFWAYFLMLMPYFWIIILLFLSFLAYFNYVHTRKGYLLNPYFVIFGSILFSVILGWALFAIGASEKIDKIFSQKIPYYRNTDSHKSDFWSNPERGLIAGKITKIKSGDNFYLEDLQNKEWEIVGKNVIWKKESIMEIGAKVKIIGKQDQENNIFQAQEVRPWGCGCHFCEDNKNNKTESCKINNNKKHSLEEKEFCSSD